MLSFDCVRKPGDKRVGTVLDMLLRVLMVPESAIRKLVMFGVPEKHYLGRDLHPFLAHLGASPLSYLDISGHHLEDKGEKEKLFCRQELACENTLFVQAPPLLPK